MNDEERLDRAVADWLLERESDPELLPGAFAARLPPDIATRFLDEIEQLAAVDGLASQTDARDLPRRLGEFRVLGELGRGAVGAVYEAEHVPTGRLVALKVLHPRIAGDRRVLARFWREARAASSLVHPGIVPVLDCGEAGDVAWLMMERVRGRSFERLLAAHSDRRDVDHRHAVSLLGDPVALATAIAEVADALEFAHLRGVVHRDVKPANLMLRDDGRCVVLDFGLATVRGDEGSALTRTGDFLGTPLYMAPEQAVGAENGGPSSDVYALGAVLYECLVGQPPMPRGPLAVVIDAILNTEPLPPHLVRRGVPLGLSRIAMQCLAKAPQQRYASAGELAADLRRWQAGEPVRARSLGRLSRLRRQIRRRPLLSGLVGAVVLLLVVGGFVWQQQLAGERRIARLEREQDLARLPALLAGAPEHITIFGGASLRHYARFGLAQAIPSDGPRCSEAAERALALAEDLCRRFPDDAEVSRTRVEVLLDVGVAPDLVDAELGRLLASPDAVAGDRAMAAVWHRRQGREQRARRVVATLPEGDPVVDYWLGFWHQSAQQHARAIEAFDRALASPQLSEERRYFALLHRGWCRSCPDVARFRAAQDDLLQAGALRPAYGTARLLWAALCCQDPNPDADLTRAVEEVTAVLRDAPPWLYVLTARVLQSIAEAGTWQDGPARFGSEFSPIAAVAIPPGRAAALAGLSLQLLDGAAGNGASGNGAAGGGESFEVAYHRAAGLALLGRHDEALAVVSSQLPGASAEQRAALLLQRGRVQLAAGRGQLAHASVEASLDQAPDFAAAWRFGAVLAGHLGDVQRELLCVTQAARLLRREPNELSVYPDAIALLPALELRRRALQARLDGGARVGDRGEESLGGVLHGAEGPRAAALEAAARRAVPSPDVARGTPLRWLLDPDAVVDGEHEVAAAAWRGWFPAARDLPETEALQPIREVEGHATPVDLGEVGLIRLLPSAARLARADRDAAARLFERVDRLLADDPENGEARLLRGLLLLATGEAGRASDYLAETAGRFPDDLRTRVVHACAAASSGDKPALRAALSRADVVLDLPTLEAAAAAVTLPVDAASPRQLLARLRD